MNRRAPSATPLLVCLAFALAGCSRDPSPAPEPQRTLEPSVEPPAVAAKTARLSGEDAYRKYCVVCHGEDGSGRNGAVSFIAAKTPLSKPDSELLVSIRDGVRGDAQAMPAHKALLSDREIAETLAYVRKSFGKHAVR